MRKTAQLIVSLAVGLLGLWLSITAAQQPPKITTPVGMQLDIMEDCMKKATFPDGSQRFTDADIKSFRDLVEAAATDISQHEDKQIKKRDEEFATDVASIICNVSTAKFDAQQAEERKQRPALAKKKLEVLITNKIKGQRKQATAETVRGALGELRIGGAASRQGFSFVRLNLVIDAQGKPDEDKAVPPPGGIEIDVTALGSIFQTFACLAPPPPSCSGLRKSFVFAQVKELTDITKADGTLTEASQQALQGIPVALKHIEGHSKDWDARYLSPMEQAGTRFQFCMGQTVRGAPCVHPATVAGSFNLVGTFFTNKTMKNFTLWVKALRDEKTVKDELKNKSKIGALLPAWQDNKMQVFFACFDTSAKAGEFNKCTSRERITEGAAGGIACQLFDLKLEKRECKPKPIDWSKL